MGISSVVTSSSSVTLPISSSSTSPSSWYSAFSWSIGERPGIQTSPGYVICLPRRANIGLLFLTSLGFDETGTLFSLSRRSSFAAPLLVRLGVLCAVGNLIGDIVVSLVGSRFELTLEGPGFWLPSAVSLSE